jgi:hypothetical protein
MWYCLEFVTTRQDGDAFWYASNGRRHGARSIHSQEFHAHLAPVDSMGRHAVLQYLPGSLGHKAHTFLYGHYGTRLGYCVTIVAIPIVVRFSRRIFLSVATLQWVIVWMLLIALTGTLAA